MPSLPVFDNHTLPIRKDPDSKKFRGTTRAWRQCVSAVDLKWLAAGFVLGMLVFGGLSMLQGGDSAAEVVLHGAGTSRDPADKPLVPTDGEHTEGKGAEHPQAEEAEHTEGEPVDLVAQLNSQRNEEGERSDGNAEQEENEQGVEGTQEAEGQSEEGDQQGRQSAMERLHTYGIRYSEREPGTPAVGGEVVTPEGDWRQRAGRRVLIYLGVDAGEELNYVINTDRESHSKEYDIAFVFEARPDHNDMWRELVKDRSTPVIEYWNKAVWTRDVVLDFGNNDHVGSVLRTKHNNFEDGDRTIQVNAINFHDWLRDHVRDNDKVTVVSDIQGAEFPVFSQLADSGLAKRIDTLYLECHYSAHADLIDSITEDSCRELCESLTPHVKEFFFWVGPNKQQEPVKLVRGFEFVNQPGLQPNDCGSLFV